MSQLCKVQFRYAVMETLGDSSRGTVTSQHPAHLNDSLSHMTSDSGSQRWGGKQTLSGLAAFHWKQLAKMIHMCANYLLSFFFFFFFFTLVLYFKWSLNTFCTAWDSYLNLLHLLLISDVHLLQRVLQLFVPLQQSLPQLCCQVEIWALVRNRGKVERTSEIQIGKKKKWKKARKRTKMRSGRMNANEWKWGEAGFRRGGKMAA